MLQYFVSVSLLHCQLETPFSGEGSRGLKVHQIPVDFLHHWHVVWPGFLSQGLRGGVVPFGGPQTGRGSISEGLRGGVAPFLRASEVVWFISEGLRGGVVPFLRASEVVWFHF